MNMLQIIEICIEQENKVKYKWGLNIQTDRFIDL